jgi:predicted dehydrogenase
MMRFPYSLRTVPIARPNIEADPRPIYIIGAGSIVRDAHLPAYRNAQLPVAGVFDLDVARARALADGCGIRAFDSREALLEECVARRGVLDLALPPKVVGSVLTAVPEGSFVLIQKPFGMDLDDASSLVRTARSRGIRGAVNFQLRHAPCVLGARELLAGGAIGEVVDVELRVVCRMPWETWPFLAGMPRMEILMHAIHYLDLVRALCGEPDRVWSAIARHPLAPHIAEARSTTAMTFGGMKRAVVTTYHHHTAPERHDASHLRIEGTRGTIVARLGVNLDYPHGRPDTLEISRDGGAWEHLPVRGHWFPHAFEGPMLNLQRLATGAVDAIESNLEDAWRTMALVETCYKSAAGGERLPGLSV